jgi:membrane protein required for colicin V production
MALVDWAILIILALTVLGGFVRGFLRSFCSLGGLLAGLALAAWNYKRIASFLLPLVRVEAIANTIGFLLIAFLIMGLAGFLGQFFFKAVHGIGLGCLDRLAGAVFGFFQGALLVTLCILITLAFFPRTHWLARATLPRYFFGACRLTTHMSPSELAARVQVELESLEDESLRWLRISHGEATL